MTMERTRAQKWKKMAFSAGLGAVCGFAATYGLLNWLETPKDGLPSDSEVAALGIALIYLLTAFATGLGLMLPKVGATFLNVEDADELREQRQMLGYSAGGTATFGLIPAVAALAGPGGRIPDAAALAIIIAMAAGMCVLGWRQWRHTDELMRAVSREAVSAGYYLLLVFGGGWALAARLGWAGAPAPLDWLTLLWTAMLAGAFIAIGRRGMLMPR